MTTKIWTTSLIAHDDNIVIPAGVTQTDWEAEFAVVIGKKAVRVSEKSKMPGEIISADPIF
jgi:2-keto-4-pentenoate hydratase/2-oxohepta-3-ene-1,7-dioic acid hydratase in catechol pathway